MSGLSYLLPLAEKLWRQARRRQAWRAATKASREKHRLRERARRARLRAAK